VISVDVFTPDGATLIAHVPRRTGVTWQEQLNDPGSGQFDLHLDDAVLAAHPTLLTEFNIVRFSQGATVVKAWQMEEFLPTRVGTAEVAARTVTVKGRGLSSLLDTAVVYPERGIVQNTTTDQRAFNFASKDGPWRVTADWFAPSAVLYTGDTTARMGFPADWPDPLASWIWSSDPNSTSPSGTNWFRSEFTLATAKDLSFFATADNSMSLYLNGELILETDPVGVRAWKTTSVVNMTLPAGTHTFAAAVINAPPAAGTNPAGFLASVYDGTSFILRTSSSSFTVHSYANPPGWHGASILSLLTAEAQARGVTSLLPVTFGYSETLDSAGQAWTDRRARTLPIGNLDLLACAGQLKEGSFDFEIDSNLVLQAWKKRGTDRRATVALTPNVDVLAATATSRVGRVRNEALVRWALGWLEVADSASRTAHGRRETGISAGNATTASEATSTATAGFEEIATPETTIPVSTTSMKGQQPYSDFFLGDTISCPAAFTGQAPARVMAITATEADNTVLTYNFDVYPEP
jgi:hypothetical protein